VARRRTAIRANPERERESMERRRHQRTLLTAIVIAVIVGAAWGQPPPTDLDAGDAAGIYREFVRRLAGYGDLGGRILSAARMGAGLDEESVEGPNVCAMLAGTGGNPRMDGGGGNPRMDGGGTVLAPFPSPGADWIYANVQDHWVGFGDVGVVDPPDLPMAVIDAFDFAEGAFHALDGVSALGVADLWRILIAAHFQVPVEDSPVPHGHLVLFHLLASWAGSDGLVVGVANVGAGDMLLSVTAESWRADVRLLDIDYDDFDSIRAAMNTARRLGEVVVVTSWGLVDCTLEAGYRDAADDVNASAHRPATFADYVAAGLEGSPDRMRLLGELCDAFDVEIETAVGRVDCDDEAFLAAIADVLTFAALAETDARARGAVDWSDAVGVTVVFASAGNQGLPFPMPPAAWPGVVGVEACVAGAVGEKAAFSNVGTTDQVGEPSARALGAWFLTPEVAADGVAPLGYWGTSFAAPAAAAAFAGDAWTPSGLEFVDPCTVGQP
jgi:hypothetical protein